MVNIPIVLTIIIKQGELAHRLVKRFYSRTNKINAVKQIAKHERRHTRLRRARDAAKAHHHRKHAHHVGFSDNDPLPYADADLHHHISDSTRYHHNLYSFIREPPNDPAKQVCNFIIVQSCANLPSFSGFYSTVKEPSPWAAS